MYNGPKDKTCNTCGYERQLPLAKSIKLKDASIVYVKKGTSINPKITVTYENNETSEEVGTVNTETAGFVDVTFGELKHENSAYVYDELADNLSGVASLVDGMFILLKEGEITLEAEQYPTITAKNVYILGQNNNVKINTPGTNNDKKKINLNGDNITIDGIHFNVTDGNRIDGIISGSGDNLTIKNCVFTGQYNLEGDVVSRGICLTVNADNYLIEGNTFKNLRQPAYLEAKGTVKNNTIENTRGWVVCQNHDITFSGNVFKGTNAEDIAIIPNNIAEPCNIYTLEKCLIISEDNNNCRIDQQPLGFRINKEKETQEASIDNVYFNTLSSALSNAKDGDTIKVLNDVTLSKTIKVEKNISLDLNGHTITGNDVRALHFASGTSEITGEGSIKVIGTTIASGSSVIRVGDGSDWKNPSTIVAKLTIGKNVTVETDACYAISVFGSLTKEEIIVKGKLTGKAGLGTSGNENKADYSPVVTLESTAEIKALEGYALYLPAAGSYTIDGTIEGPGAICTKAGNLTVAIGEGAIITATGTAGMEHEGGYANGPATKNYAVMVENNSAYGGPASVVINGGTITGSIGIYNDATYIPSDEQKGIITITGGIFSSDPSAYVPVTCFVQKNLDDTFTVTVMEEKEAIWDDFEIYSKIGCAINKALNPSEEETIDASIEYHPGTEAEPFIKAKFNKTEVTLAPEDLIMGGIEVQNNVEVILDGMVLGYYDDSISDAISIMDFRSEYTSVDGDSHKVYSKVKGDSNPTMEICTVDKYIVTGIEQFFPSTT